MITWKAERAGAQRGYIGEVCAFTVNRRFYQPGDRQKYELLTELPDVPDPAGRWDTQEEAQDQAAALLADWVGRTGLGMSTLRPARNSLTASQRRTKAIQAAQQLPAVTPYFRKGLDPTARYVLDDMIQDPEVLDGVLRFLQASEADG